MKLIKNKTTRKLVIISLCVGLVASMFSSVTTGLAQVVVNQFNETILGLPSNDYLIQVPNVELDTETAQNDDLLRFSELQEEEVFIHQSIETQSKVNSSLAKSLQIDVKKQDFFNLTKEQIEQLIFEGYSFEDIYKLDELSNELMIDPETLANRKEELQLDWDSLKATIQEEQLEGHLVQFKEKFPVEFEVLKKEKFNNQDNLMLLSMLEQGKGTIDELIHQFKTTGEPGIMSMSQFPSKNIQSQRAGSFSDSVDPIILESLRELSEETGTPLNELVDSFMKAKSSVDQVLVKKE